MARRRDKRGKFYCTHVLPFKLLKLMHVLSIQKINSLRWHDDVNSEGCLYSAIIPSLVLAKSVSYFILLCLCL